ncbi:MAG: DUF3854 domain-containing protein [Planctomycetaceae bacterium]|nr:DUF3854 domain-containing protein [Planctomycetaceae bacterium]
MQTTHETTAVDQNLSQPSAGSLHDHHRRSLHERGLTDAMIEAAGLYTESVYAMLAAKMRWKNWPKVLGPAIVIPYRDENGVSIGLEKLRPDNPRRDQKGRQVKYLWPSKTPPRIFFPPGIKEALADIENLFVTEGEFKSIVGTSRGFPTIGLPGVYGLFQKGSADPPIEIDRINWKRPVYVVFDSDLADNPQVRQAEARTAAILRRRGATVKVLRLPDGPQGEKVGLDDYLATHTDGDFHQLINAAEDPDDEPTVQAREPAKDCDSMYHARRILDDARDAKGVLRMRFHRGAFYVHNGKKYVEWSDDDVRAAIVQYLDRYFHGLKTSTTSNVLECVKSESNVLDSLDRPVWLGRAKRSQPTTSRRTTAYSTSTRPSIVGPMLCGRTRRTISRRCACPTTTTVMLTARRGRRRSSETFQAITNESTCCKSSPARVSIRNAQCKSSCSVTATARPARVRRTRASTRS